jgi:hypothetical protein
MTSLPKQMIQLDFFGNASMTSFHTTSFGNNRETSMRYETRQFVPLKGVVRDAFSVIHLDIYIIRDSEPLAFRTDHLKAAVDSCLGRGWPVIVEGVLLLDVLDSIGRRPDFLVLVEKEDRNDSNLRKQVPPYLKRREPRESADRVLKWSSAEHDASACPSARACE